MARQNYQANIEYHRAYSRMWRSKNIDKERARGRKVQRKLRRENYDKYLAYGREYYRKHPEKWYKANRAYFIKNKERVRAARRAYLATNPNAKISMLLRSRIWEILKEQKAIKTARTLELLGAGVDVVRKHLESQFKVGMSWENHGLYGWHIDHKKPCDAFDLTEPDQQKLAFHYTNLQPLWATENLSKGSKWHF